MYAQDAIIAPEPQPSWKVLNGVRRAPRRTVPRAWVAGLLALLVTTLVLYVHTVNQEFALAQEQRDIAVLKQKLAHQRMALAKLQSPPRVEAEAVKKLSMQAPAEVVFMAPPKLAKATATNRIPLPPAVVHEGF